VADLGKLRCTACRGDEPPLSRDQIQELLQQVPEWRLESAQGVDRLERSFEFEDFAEALGFTNRVGELAEQEGHHPVIELTWGRAIVRWWTHEIGGLHTNDFIMAAKTDELYSG
jgi:4a-hydroxytetrahydrobiopterin dehydratase